ncbi:unnamed protein product, partial [Adineta steineri]
SSSSSSSSSDEDEDEDEDDVDERNILLALQDAQQQRVTNSSPLRPIIENAEIENNLNHVTSNINNANSESLDQRSQIVSSSFNRFPLLGSFKRQRSETSSEESDSEPDLFFTTRIPHDDDDDDDHDDDDSDDETAFYSISNNNNNTNKLRCFEMNGCDLLDGGKRRRH